MKRGPNLIVKLSAAGNPHKQIEHLQSLLDQYEVDHVEQLFPDEVEEELSTLYTINLAKEGQVEKAKDTLMQDQDVEYAHVPQARGINLG